MSVKIDMCVNIIYFIINEIIVLMIVSVIDNNVKYEAVILRIIINL